jgi:putative membrane protein
MASLYPWLKAFHIIALIAWMAGSFYLPRLFVYHAGVAPGSEASETFKVMERRLLKAIMTPAMGATWILGLSLMVSGGWYTAGWLHAKLLFVITLSAFHGFCGRLVKDFAEDRNTRPARFYRILNEVPTVLLVVIVLLVVLKPF